MVVYKGIENTTMDFPKNLPQMLVKIIFIGRLNSVNVFWLNGQSVLKSDLLDKYHYANTFVIAIIAARSKSKGRVSRAFIVDLNDL